MTKIELLNHQIEYETTEISIDELCSKYKIQKKQLKGHTTWTKRNEIIVPEVLSPTPTNTSPTAVISNSKLLSDIELFKQRAIAYALDNITDPQYLEIREFKDLVSIVDTIEKSTKDTNTTTPTINLMINNLMMGLKDDC